MNRYPLSVLDLALLWRIHNRADVIACHTTKGWVTTDLDGRHVPGVGRLLARFGLLRVDRDLGPVRTWQLTAVGRAELVRAGLVGKDAA